MNQVIVICGPTASGKSALAIKLAQKKIALNPVIINADSMQIYQDIKIIAASPTPSEYARIPHELYGILASDEYCSVADYASKASKLIQNLLQQGKLPIIVGGTGLYINALLYGYSAIPAIDAALRQTARTKLQDIGNQAFFMELIALDSQVMERLKPGDSQRLLRAYEVVKQSGQSIFDYHKIPPIKPLPQCEFTVLMTNPTRELLYRLCNERFYQLIEKGAIAEVQKLLANNFKVDASVFKAVGVQEIISYLQGDITLTRAIELAQIKTRQYAKRQVTWFNHQLRDKIQLNFTNIKEYDALLTNDYLV